MRITLAQLRKLKMPYYYSEELNLSEELKGFEDIVDLGLVYVDGKVEEIGIDKYMIQMNIKVDLILSSAISLKELPYKIELSCEEIFATDSNDDMDVNMIINQMLDTKEAVMANIIINKPMRVIAEGEELVYQNEETTDEDLNQAFASLKDWLDKK